MGYGYMEALREVPGFLNALFIAIMIHFAPPIVGGLSLILMEGWYRNLLSSK